MPVDLRSAEPLATIADYRATALLPRQPEEGVAYEALAHDGRRVDLVVVPARDRAFASRFLAAAAALQELSHQHLPAVLGAGEAREGLYLATERVEGRSLEELIGDSGGLSPMRAVRLLGEGADALDAAHAAGVLHRALSPACVVVEERPLESVQLVGFALGLAVGESHLTGDRAAYTSPEEARAQPAGAASDVYSFACLMFECLAGAPPFRGESPADVLAAHAGEPPPAASALRPGLPAALDRALARGLSKRPADRQRSAAALVAEAARAVMSAEPTPEAPAPAGPPPPVPVLAPPATGSQLRSRLAGATLPAALAAVLIGGAAVGGWLAGRPDSEASAKLSSGELALTMPAGWGETQPVRQLGTLNLGDAVGAQDGTGARVDAGRVRGTLPGRAAERIAVHPGRSEAVRLGDLQAYVWRGVEERGGGRPMSLFAAGTDTGVVVVACRGAAGARAGCERAAGSLVVPVAVPARLGELGSWTARLERTLDRLNRRRRTGRSRLRAARSAHGQAVAARALEKAYSRAARSLSAHRAPIGAERAQRSIASSLRDVAAPYRDLANAISHSKARGYRAARRSITARERALRRVLRRL